MGKGMVGCQCGTQDLGPQLMVNHWMINIMHGREYITVVLTGKTGTGMHPVSKIGHMEIQWENSRNMIFPWEKTGVMIVFLEHGFSWVSEMTTIATLHRHSHTYVNMCMDSE